MRSAVFLGCALIAMALSRDELSEQSLQAIVMLAIVFFVMDVLDLLWQGETYVHYLLAASYNADRGP